jgi:hypothetical protein
MSHLLWLTGKQLRRFQHLSQSPGWRGLRTCYVDQLPALSVSTLILHGANDPLLPVAVAERAHRLIRLSRLEVIPDCGHLAPLDQPEAVSRALKTFLQPADCASIPRTTSRAAGGRLWSYRQQPAALRQASSGEYAPPRRAYSSGSLRSHSSGQEWTILKVRSRGTEHAIVQVVPAKPAIGLSQALLTHAGRPLSGLQIVSQCGAMGG